MNIKYSKLIGDDNLQTNFLRWARNNLPVTFLKQQIFLVALIIGSFLLLVFTQLFTNDIDEYDIIDDWSKDLSYGVIVDCGSSGTRAHIFRWKPDDKKPVQIELVRSRLDGKPLNKHITPGLSSLKDEPDKASEYMEPIMNFISESIPIDRHLDTPVYFMATAGLRLLEDTTQKKLLSDITRDLRSKYDFPRIKSQVISGEYEGVYSWLSLNMKKIYGKADGKRSFGVIEVGGASTQVTFELDPEVENSILRDLKSNDAITTFRNEQVTLKLGPNESVKLFAATFLGLGVNSGREYAIDLLVRDYLKGTGELGFEKKDLDNFEIRLKDPCLTIGSSEIFLRPAALLHSLNQSVGFVIKQHDRTFKVRLEGSGNFLNCLNLLNRVMQVVKKEKLNCPHSKQHCSMSLLGTDFIPYQHYQFIGLSEMYFTTNEMMNSAGLFNRSHVLRETNRICSTEYNRLLEMYSPNGVSYEDRILYECFKATWILTLLHNNCFRMPLTYDNLVTTDRLDGREIDWTIGAMISEIGFNTEDSLSGLN